VTVTVRGATIITAMMTKQRAAAQLDRRLRLRLLLLLEISLSKVGVGVHAMRLWV
jgi:hypothetical protein